MNDPQRKAIPLTINADDGAHVLEDVRRAARSAARERSTLEIVVVYSTPSPRSLERLRRIVPEELRWRVHGAVEAERIAGAVLQVARGENARVAIWFTEAERLRRPG